MKTKIFTLAVLFAPALTYGQQSCKEVFISEYIDGPFKNKVLEIFNPSDSVKSLIGYSIKIFQNGAPTPLDIPLLGNVNPKKTYVIAHPQADTAILAKADQIDVKMNFDGNDAVVLNKDQSTYIDKIGEIGIDPGTNGWTVPPSGSTKDHDLRRQYPIDKGETDWNQGKNQWDVFPGDSAQNIRQHKNKCTLQDIVNFSITSSSYKEKYNISNPDIALTVNISAAPQGLCRVNVLNNIDNPQVYCSPNPVSFGDIQSSPILLEWNAGDGSSKTISVHIWDDNVFEPNETYCLELTDNITTTSCTVGSNYQHKLTVENDDVSAINEIQKNKVKISPSIATEKIFFEVPLSGKPLIVTIKNVLGQTFVTKEGTQINSIDVSGLSSGYYIITIQQEILVITGNFIKQ